MELSKTQFAGAVELDQKPDFIIGDDVLELISSAMYVDPLTMFREYIQNSADAIDEAKNLGVLEPDHLGTVSIEIDVQKRSILIRDNGAGVPESEFVSRLLSLGASKKRGQSSRGFRGVGRLAGLGYAKKLVFRSSTAGLDKVQELTWDCVRLRQLLKSDSERSSVSDLIAALTTYREFETDGYPDHFFEVELSGVIRLKSDKLLDKSAISKFLGEVAPVPFSANFADGPLIAEKLSTKVRLTDLNIIVGGLDTPVHRPHCSILNDNNRTIEIAELEFVEFPDVNGELAAIGWIAHHQYEGSLPASLAVKGLRFRCGNMQIGGDDLVEHLFPETRFNSWSIGEIHILDPKIVPNARRDNFEENAAFNNLLNQLSPLTRQLAKRCRDSSQIRNWKRLLNSLHDKIDSGIEILELGGMSENMTHVRIESVRTDISNAKQLHLKLKQEHDGFETYAQRLEKVIANLNNTKSANIISSENIIAGRFIDLIYQHTKDTSEAKRLVKLIMANIDEAAS
jgi:molecular chaperone HtpG